MQLTGASATVLAEPDEAGNRGALLDPASIAAFEGLVGGANRFGLT